MTEAGTDELQFGDYIALFKRRWRWVAFTTLAVFTLVAIFTFTRDEVYEAEAQVLVLTEESTRLFGLSAEVEQRLWRTESTELSYLESDPFAELAAEATGDPGNVVTYRMTATGDIDTPTVVVFTAEASDAETAFEWATIHADTYRTRQLLRVAANSQSQLDQANAKLDRLEAERAELVAPINDLSRQLALSDDPTEVAQLTVDIAAREDAVEAELSVLDEQISNARVEIVVLGQVLDSLEDPEAITRVQGVAEVPSEPISPNVPRNLALGLVAGLVLGLIAAIVRDLLDRRPRDTAGIAQLVDVPVIAAIPRLPSQRSAPGGVRRFEDLTDADASGYRVLLNSLWLSTIDGPLQSIAFTSDRPGVGKTQTVVNLAQAEAARGTNVLVIDTDFVNPSVATRLGLERSDAGLGDLLGTDAEVDTVLTPTGITNLDFIDAFAVGEHAGDLLRSDRLRMLLTKLYLRYDLIVLDSPPTLSTADSRLVASQADASVVVYDPSLSRVDELQRAIELLRSARVNLIGLVANRSQTTHPVYVSMAD